MNIKITEGKFEPTVKSLQQYECPEWFKNAKFGIWAHWGPQCVPEYGDWYARHMYIEGTNQYKYHCEKYGHPSKFGYKDIIPLWTAEKFDAEKLMKLYKKVGAKYFIALAVHHDNFDCWDSKYHSWNSVNYGPKRDIVGEWKKAADKEGLHFGVTVHHERSYSWFNTNKNCDSEGEFAGIPYDGNDSNYEELYFEKHSDQNSGYPDHPTYDFVKGWYDRIDDLMQKYNPDLLYTDGSVPFGEVGLSAIANFYNHNMKVNNGQLNAVYNMKDLKGMTAQSGILYGDFYEDISVLDLEKGVATGILENPWQTDTCLGDWFYTADYKYKTGTMLVRLLIDIVSKNGNLLLNFPIKYDGTLDDKEIEIANEIGDWMAVNSEAIYDTTPFTHYGEISQEIIDAIEKNKAEARFDNQNNDVTLSQLPYNAKDFRFTKKGDIIYAISMGYPENGYFEIKSFGRNAYKNKISKVEMLGADYDLEFTQKEDKLLVKAPQNKPCKIAFTLKIS